MRFFEILDIVDTGLQIVRLAGTISILIFGLYRSHVKRTRVHRSETNVGRILQTVSVILTAISCADGEFFNAMMNFVSIFIFMALIRNHRIHNELLDKKDKGGQK